MADLDIPIIDLEPLTHGAEVALFQEFWQWLRPHLDQSGVAVYCWNDSAEAGAMRRLGALAGVSHEVDELLDGPNWIDLLRTFRRGFVTGTDYSLKTVAPRASNLPNVPETSPSL